MTKKTFIILVVIIALGVILRTYGLDKSPPSLNWDEAALGYNAYSLMRTGRDEYGKYLPLFTRSFDDYKSAIPSYLAIPLIMIFGLTQTSVRLTSALSGTISILLIYLIGRKMLKSETAALFSAFFFAIAPFAVFFSRGFFEANIALMFFLLGITFFLYREIKGGLYFACLFLVISMYTYHSYKLFVPVTFATLVWLNRSLFFKKGILALLGLTLLPFIILTLFGQTATRFFNTSIFKLWPPDRYPHFSFIWEIAGRYIGYFSPANLFLKESKEPGLIIPSLAILYPFQFIFWVIGLIQVFKERQQHKLLIALTIFAPLPAIITWNWFQSVRVLPLFALLILITGYGASIMVKRLNWLLILIIFFGCWNAAYLFDSLVVILPMKYSGNWQPGFKEAIPVIASIQNQYDHIIVDTPQANPYIFVLFYQSYPPPKYLQEINYQKVSIVPRKYYDFGKYQFRQIYWPDDRNKHKYLFLGSEFGLPEQDIKNQPNARIVKDVIGLDGSISFRIVTLD